MKLYFLFLILLFNNGAIASVCYKYKVRGQLQIRNERMFIVVNKGTLSEGKFLIKERNYKKMFGFLEKYIEGEILFKTKLVKAQQEVFDVFQVKEWIPDPLFNKKTLVFEKEKSCSRS